MSYELICRWGVGMAGFTKLITHFEVFLFFDSVSGLGCDVADILGKSARIGLISSEPANRLGSVGNIQPS